MAATKQALKSIFERPFDAAEDLPVGAAVGLGNKVLGSYFAIDKMTGEREKHAEQMAVREAAFHFPTLIPNTIVTTVEPCGSCQRFIASKPDIQNVGFIIPRAELEDRGLVKKHAETIHEEAVRMGYDYDPIQVIDPLCYNLGLLMLDHTKRNSYTEIVEVDADGLRQDLVDLGIAA